MAGSKANDLLTIAFLEKALGISPQGKGFSYSQNLSQISTDSRIVSGGTVFIALVGENADGHKFISKAVSLGAKVVVCAEKAKVSQEDGIAYFVVPDTLVAYRKIAKAWRQFFSIPVLAVAGSAGKTTTKEFLAALVGGRWKHVLKTQASQNGYTGIPATLLSLHSEHEVAVIEVGIDEPGAMADHLQIVQPTAGVLTSIGEEHLEKLVDIETVAKEEGRLFDFYMHHEGAIAINLDDPWIAKVGAIEVKARKLYYGLGKRPASLPAAANYLAGKWQAKHSEEGLVVSGFGDEIGTVEFALPLPGEHNARNLLSAIALAWAAGVAPEEMRVGLQGFTPPSGRTENYLWKDQIRVIADTYNANPLSTKTALAFLKKSPTVKRTWAVLGDMLELGPNAESMHRALAENLIDLQVDFVLLHGPMMQHLCNELPHRGFRGTTLHADKVELANLILQRAAAGDVILIKGSRGMRMEEVWEKMKESYGSNVEKRGPGRECK